MHKYLFNILLFLLPIGSCNEPPQGSKDGGVIFSKVGGTQSISVHSIKEKTLGIWDLNDSNSIHYGVDNGDTVVVSYQWLTVKAPQNSDQLLITAEPNMTAKRRELGVVCEFEGNNIGDIYVEQQP